MKFRTGSACSYSKPRSLALVSARVVRCSGKVCEKSRRRSPTRRLYPELLGKPGVNFVTGESGDPCLSGL